MSTTPATAAPSVGQALLTLLEYDVLQAGGTPFLQFLTAVQSANGDPIKEGAALLQLNTGLVTSLPGFIGGFESQLAELLASKVMALQAKVQAALPAASAAIAPAPAKT